VPGEELAIGGELTANLRLVRPLGRGGMGVLWIAEHRALGHEVVVKFLSDELLGNLSAAKRIAREAAAAARVRSPHVVQVFDHGVSESGMPFIVMELLSGCDLHAFLEARGALSVGETTAILQQLAKALAKTHAAGIVHRDVKPSNIFLCDSEGEMFVKLLDFGLAQHPGSAHSSSTGSPHCAGTPPYMSPEQIVGGAVDARSDVWSLGAVAFECLTGRRPFEGETLGAFALAIHTLSLPTLTQIKPGLPPEIDAWFAHACARTREDRFGSAMEAAEALARALGTEVPASPSARPFPSLALRDRTITDDFALTRAQVRRLAKPRRTPAAWIASAALALAAAAGGAYHVAVRPKSSPVARNLEPVPMASSRQRDEAPEPAAAPEPTASGGQPPPVSQAGSGAPHAKPPVNPPRRISALSPSATAPPTPVLQVEPSRRAPRANELPDERY
jgi:serine/threonine protein kinase